MASRGTRIPLGFHRSPLVWCFFGAALGAAAAQACAKGGNSSGTGGSTNTTSWITSSSTAGAGGVNQGGGGAGGTTTTSSSTTSSSTTSSSTTSSGGAGGAGGEGGVGQGGAGGGLVAYSHTVNVADNGVNDFVVANERFNSSSLDSNPNPPDDSYYGFFAWDASYFYLGMQGPDIASNDPNKLVLVYLSGVSGTTTGYTYTNQQPTLPFGARYHVHWSASNNDTVAYEWTGSWTNAGWDFTGDVYKSGTYLEMRIPLVDIGDPSALDVHLCMVNRLAGSEWTYAAVPSNSLVDGYEPNYQHYFAFDLGGPNVPNTFTPQ